MDAKNYGNERFRIYYGSYQGVEKFAVNELYKVVQQYIPYLLTIKDSKEKEDLVDYFPIVVGTIETNEILKELYDKGLFVPETSKEGFSIKVCDSPFANNKKVIILQGADPNGVIYAVRDFEHRYVENKLKYNGYHYSKKYQPFLDPMLDFEYSSYPKIANRGLWSWGHAVYDYRNYIDNMSKWKMNNLILWNDHVPINAKEIVDYAHERGIKVIWGYSWCWGEVVDPNNKEELDKWTDYAIKTYEEQYLPLNSDGIYFQAFTEIEETEIGGRLVAELVTDWVNYISQKLLDRHPDLWIQFGLHASSIKDYYKKLNIIDKRVSIVWEDCGGFPYFYDPEKIDDFSKTYEYTKNIVSLRGREERFGAVLKGHTVLNWKEFEHQKGIIVMGESKKERIKKKTKDVEFFWKHSQAYWITQSKELKDILTLVADTNQDYTLISMLVEEGMWEEKCYFSAVFQAEMMWNPNVDVNKLIEMISHCYDCVML